MNKVKTRQIAADKEVRITCKALAGTFDEGKNYKTISSTQENGEPKSLDQLLEEIFTQREKPTVKLPTATITAGGVGAYEAGTEVHPTFTINTNPGDYEYGPATGVTFDFSHATVKLMQQGGSPVEEYNGVQTLSEGRKVLVTDTYTSENPLAFETAGIEYSDGVAPLDNLGDAMPESKIQGGTLQCRSAQGIRGYRQYFYGTVGNTGEVTTDTVRALAGKGGANLAAGKTLTINVAAGAKRVLVAVPKSQSVNFRAVLATSMNADITGEFEEMAVDVEGAGKYQAVPYRVFVWQPATFQGNEQVKVTL